MFSLLLCCAMSLSDALTFYLSYIGIVLFPLFHDFCKLPRHYCFRYCLSAVLYSRLRICYKTYGETSLCISYSRCHTLFFVLSICILDSLQVVFLWHKVLSSTNTSVIVSADFVSHGCFFPCMFCNFFLKSLSLEVLVYFSERIPWECVESRSLEWDT